MRRYIEGNGPRRRGIDVATRFGHHAFEAKEKGFVDVTDYD